MSVSGARNSVSGKDIVYVTSPSKEECLKAVPQTSQNRYNTDGLQKGNKY